MKIRKFLFGVLIAISAFAIAISAAYFSIFGLSKIYAGAFTSVIIMAASLELGKLVATSALQQYWGKISKWLRFYVIIGIITLMLITSAGIYGFLTNAYKQTSNQYQISNKEISIVEFRRDRFSEERKEIQFELKIVKQDINNKNLTLANLRNNTDTIISQYIFNKRIRETKRELNELVNYRIELNEKYDIISDSISNMEIKILDLSSNNEAQVELGPLIYLSDITGFPMDKVVNWFTLLIVFVFDPMAISLILILNTIFLRKKDKPKEKEKEEIDEIIEPISPIEEPIEEPIEIINQTSIAIKFDKIQEVEINNKKRDYINKITTRVRNNNRKD